METLKEILEIAYLIVKILVALFVLQRLRR